jgi:putative addiction module antidote
MSSTHRLNRLGNSTGLVLPKDILDRAGLARGDSVTITAKDDLIEIRKGDSLHDKAMAAGTRVAQRYRSALRQLAK